MSKQRAERRLAAILSADVAGYSRLMAADDDGTVRRLGEYRQEITRLVEGHGLLVDFTGDNFLAKLPSALDAVECAIEIQESLRERNSDLEPEQRMQFRVGVHLGDVQVEGERIFGNGVNIASRLEVPESTSRATVCCSMCWGSAILLRPAA